MSTFYYDQLSGESAQSQWIKYLQANSYIKDFQSIIERNRQELQLTMQTSSSDQINAINHVCSSIQDGFSDITYQLSGINNSIDSLTQEMNDMSSMLDWKLSMLIEEVKGTNQLLGHIGELLRIPDSQKERVYYIEKGLKYLVNAMMSNGDTSHYKDALEAFKEAEKKESKDFIVLNKIGVIYLYSERHLNFQLAETYFLASAREALAEYNINGTSTANNFRPVGFKSEYGLKNYYLGAAAEAYLYAARACYLQLKFADARKYAGEAYSRLPEFQLALFEMAKYTSADGQDQIAATLLEKLIEKNRLFAITTIRDKDLAIKPAIISLLEKLKVSAVNRASIELAKCKSKILPNSNAANLIREIDKLVSRNSYLSALKAIDLLNMSYDLSYFNYQNQSEVIIRQEVTKKLRIIDLLEIENENAQKLQDLINKAKAEILRNSIKAHLYFGGVIGLVLGILLALTSDVKNPMMLIIIITIAGLLVSGILGYINGANNEPKLFEK